MTLSRRVGRGAVLQIGARLFSAVSTFVVTAVLLARVLPEAEYGRFQFYLTFFLLAMALVDFGVNRAAIRMVAAGEAGREEVLRAALQFKARAGLLAFLVIGAVAVFSEVGAARWLIVLASLHTVTHALASASLAFEVDVDFRVPARSVCVGYSVFLGAGVGLALGGVETAAPYLIAWAIGLTTQNVFLFLAACRRCDLTVRVDRAILGRLVRESLPLGISAVASAIYFYIDTIMLRPLRGPEEVAQYAVAYRLMTFGIMVPLLFGQVIFPVLTRCHGAGRELLARAVERSTFYMAFLGAVATGGLVGLAPDLLALVFGERYRGAAPTLQVVAFAMLCVFVTSPHVTALIAAGHAATWARITVLSAALNVGLNLIVIPPFGPIGAAATTLVTEATVLIASVVRLRRLVGVTGVSRELFGPAALLIVLVGALLVLMPAGSLASRIALVVVVSIAAALVLRVWPFRLGVDEEELG